MTNLGDLYYDGKVIEQDFKKAGYYYSKSANLGNSMGIKISSII